MIDKYYYYVCMSKVLHFCFKTNKSCFSDIKKSVDVVIEKKYIRKGLETTNIKTSNYL